MRRQVPDLAAFHHHHAVRAGGHHQGADAKLLAQGLRLFAQHIKVANGTEGGGELPLVGLQQVGTCVGAERLEFGVHHNFGSGLLAGRKQTGGRRQSALVVVAQHQRHRIRQMRRQLSRQGLGRLRRQGRFKVAAQQLLLAADHPDFLDGGPLVHLHEVAIDARCLQNAPQRSPRRIAANATEQCALRPKADQVQGDVGGAARTILHPLHRHHRHRRLRRNAPSVSVPIAVQHEVPHHQHMEVFQGG